MRFFAIIGILILFAVVTLTAQDERDFSGVWKLNRDRSEIRALPRAPDPILKVEQTGAALQVSATQQEGAPAVASTYPLDGKEAKRKIGDTSASSMTKWEGSALLVNTLVSGSQSYTVMERWKRSRDGRTLTIRRTIVRASGETESVLVYDNPSIAANASHAKTLAPAIAEAGKPATLTVPGNTRPAGPEQFEVESGTRILLSLVTAVNTKHVSPGDRVYLQTAVPVMAKGRVVIPRGSYVTGVVTDAQRAGRVKGKPSLQLRFDSLTLPNGTMRDFRSRPGGVDGQGDVSRAEGKIKGDGNKGGDAKTVGTTTAAGTSVGSIAGSAAGHGAMGAGIGAAAGAAAGLIGVLGSRGPDLILPQGSTMEMVLDRSLRYTVAELQ